MKLTRPMLALVRSLCRRRDAAFTPDGEPWSW
jgi:hypothetical protein